MLPLEREGVAAPVSEPAPARSRGRVLIVEDDPIVRFSVAALMHEWGCNSVSAASGEEALDLATRDGLPVRCDRRRPPPCWTAHRRRNRQGDRAPGGRPVPTMALTGDTGRERLTEFEASGFVVLHKPVEAESLRRELTRLLGA